MLEKINVDLKNKSYPIYIEAGLLEQTGNIFRTHFPETKHKVLIISDDNVFPIYGKIVKEQLQQISQQVKQTIIPAGEPSKDIENLKHIYNILLKNKFNRSSVIIALGGGVVGDLAGLAAATYMRGINFLQFPTSLLAQVDSSVGGKTAINFQSYKNIIGSFYQPKFVLVDTKTLLTLNEREYRTGLAEVIKYSVSLDADFFYLLEDNKKAIKAKDLSLLKNIIEHCCRLKADIVKQDEMDTDIRAKLNLGHTIGHGIEASGNKINHGESVAIGMVYESYLAQKLGLIKTQQINRIIDLLRFFQLPVQIPDELNKKSILRKIKLDKKAKADKIFMALPQNIGSTIITANWDESALKEILKF
ncbi:MAG: 3-dehydroquinate synthase [Bacillota bacterium]